MPRCCAGLAPAARRASIDQPLAQLALGRPDRRRRGPCRRPARTRRRRRSRGRHRATSASSKTSRATQVGACTPLVIELIGTSASSKAGHRPSNISRLTWPCSSETPLARCGEPEAHHGHVEDARVAALVVLGAEGQHVLDGYAGRRAGLAEVLLDQLAREPVDAGRHGRVGGEDGAGPGDLERGVEVELGPPSADGELADPLEAEEAGVALVGVEHLGRRARR